MKVFTGIGSRIVPSSIFNVLYRIGKLLNQDGWTLRTGTAEGCDQAFRDSYAYNPTKIEIYSPRDILFTNKYGNKEQAIQIARMHHPCYDRIQSEYVKALLARNTYQIFGNDLNSPSDIVFCYTENAEIKGGSAIVLRIAYERNIPVVNLGNPKHLQAIINYINQGIFIQRLNKAFNY